MSTNSDPYGLDAGARLAAQQAAERIVVPPPLEPEFPWTVQSFDPVFFGITADPVFPKTRDKG